MGRWKSVVSVLLGAWGCVPAPSARSVIGPDGTPMYHLSCPSDQATCFELAGQHCPAGYKIFPVFDPSDNHYLVRCRGAATVVANSAPIGPPPAVASAALPETRAARWPPPAESWATPDPWPTASTSTESPPRASESAEAEIDLGY